MQVTVEDVSAVKKILHINIPEKDITDELDAAFLNLKKTAKVKGFRPGKIPRSVLENMFGKEVRAEVISKLMQDAFIDALNETQVSIVGKPEFNSPQFEPGKPYQFDATIEVKPEIGAIDFKGLALKKSVYDVSGSEVDLQLQMLQKRLARKEEIAEERPVQDGDFVLLNYEGMENGQPFGPIPKSENVTMKIGTATILKAFDDEILGMRNGEEKTFKVQFPADYANKDLAGREIDFTVMLKAIQKEVLPEIDDRMAKDLGPFDSLDALRDEIQKNLKEGYERRIEQELNEQIFTTLIDKTDFEIPESMVQYELEGILADAQKTFEMGNMTMEQIGQTREKLAEQYRGVAEQQARRHLILDAIIKQEDMTIADEELAEGFKDMAAAFGQPVDAVKTFYQQQPDKLPYFKHALLEKKAIKLILEQSEITEQTVESNPENETQAPSE